MRLGEMTGFSGLGKAVLLSNRKRKLAGLEKWEDNSTANTAIGFTPDGKLWALMEAGPPFRFYLDKDGVPRSIGFDTLLDTHQRSISAHPKFDQRTGEIIFHGKDIGPKSDFFVGRAIDGKLVDCVSIKKKNGFDHDLILTENYAIVIDGSLIFDVKDFIKQGFVWTFKPSAKLRFGVLPRSCFGSELNAESFIWVEADIAGDIIHYLHGYDDNDTITIWAPMCWHDPEKDYGILRKNSRSKMRRFVIDVKKKSVEVQEVPGGEDYWTDFPRIRDDRVGLNVRCGFSGIFEEGPDFLLTGILKWDFESCRLDSVIKFPDGVIGGEPVFFPSSKPSGEDDDGYIGMFLWDTKLLQSTFAIFDAKSFSSTPVAELSIPCRVPLGFHAAWITEDQFQRQLAMH